MNYQFNSANVNYGDPNAQPSNPTGTQALNIPQQAPQQQQQTPQNQNNLGYFSKYINFLNSKTGTILASAIGMAIGFAFKDFIASCVTNVLQPLLILIISLLNVNNYYDLTAYISPQKNALNMTSFFSSLLTFIFTVITVYYVNQIISNAL